MTTRLSNLSGELGERPIHEVVRAIQSAAATGTLEVTLGDQKRRLHFVQGELYLAATHPLAQHFGELVGQLGESGSTDARNRCFELVQRMAAVIGEWRAGSYRFDGDSSSVPAERVGPLPTERLAMMTATIGVDESELLARLGGPAGQLASRVTPREPDALGLLPEEQFLIERMSQPMTVERITAESPVPREHLLRAMVQLKSAGRLRSTGRDASGVRSLVVQTSPEAEFATRLFDRFARNLREEPLALSVEEYRRQVTELIGKVGGLNAYEILGVDPTTPSETVQARYEELARLVHPGNETVFGVSGLKPMLEMLFDKATQSYFNLADPERRRLYNEAHAIDLSGGGVSGPRREEEQREVGRSHYEQALTMAARGEFHFAVELLELALKAERKVEYFLALARIQAKNPKWSSRAIVSCRAALEIDPHNADVRFQLGELYEAAGDVPRARAQYLAAARENPHHAQAAAKVRALESAESKGAGGLFDRLFGRRT